MLTKKILRFVTKYPSRGFHFPTTHVGTVLRFPKRNTIHDSVSVSFQGSLPRPPSVLAYLKDRKDEAIPADILETAVKETVQKQIEAF